MDVVSLARWQFAAITVYHFLFVPITLGLSIFLAILETQYVRTGDENYKKAVKFWGKLFLINFAIGVATGIIQEFQFGMNWSEYSRFMGDIFGAPLAIEALLAFYMESTFLGLWVFGWDKLSKKQHLATIWLVALGSNLSALWILIANSFMQEPVGYAIRNGRAEMTDFLAIATNTHVLYQFPHVITGAIAMAGFLVMGVSAWQLRKNKSGSDVFKLSFKYAAVYAAFGSITVAGLGHAQAQYMVKEQPMKMAAAEALYETEDPAAISLFSIVDEDARKDVFSIRIPYGLSLLAHDSFSGEVRGINDIQKEYEGKYGPGNYIPPVTLSYWNFRIMVGAGTAMILLVLLALFAVWKKKLGPDCKLLIILPWAIMLPTIATSTGWIFTEIARQPWIVFGLQKTEDAISKATSAGEVLASLVLYIVLYTGLMVADSMLMFRYARRELDGETASDSASTPAKAN